MIVDDQHEVVNHFMASAFRVGTGSVEHVQTHISHIFLAGNRAFKVKRAVKLPYVDFSTPQLRLEACEKEVCLNSVTAPGLYLGVRRLVRGPEGRISFGEQGELVDAAIEMLRFDQSALLDRMAIDGRLNDRLIDDVAALIAGFHDKAPVAVEIGGTANMAGVLAINAAGFRTSNLFDAGEVAVLGRRFAEALSGHSALLDSRAANGRIRRCHGDLHLRNICMLDGKPRLFDCIEFNDEIATIDVLYDLAFLLMDLWHRGFPGFANRLMNRYLDIAGDDNGFALLPFFMAVRAAVRAHVAATQSETAGKDRDRIAEEARIYFDLAGELLSKQAPVLLAIGGLSGTGKTTLAEALAPRVGRPPGARIIESDRVRKQLFGVAPESRLPAQAYAADVSQHVYATMVDRAHAILVQEASVVADAVFDRVQDRVHIENAARRASVPFSGFWLSASADVLRARVAARRGGPSDATVILR
jgi:aminoglycoside phosphotransferase family enzyme/predicted kinase